MSEQKSFLLRLPKPILDAYQKWAEDDLRSLNGQLEYVLREALKKNGRNSGSENKSTSSKKKNVG
jgi:hypothetical protein